MAGLRYLWAGVEVVSAPPMPEGFTDRAAWDAIHWRFSADGSALDDAVISWQRENQDRVRAATEAQRCEVTSLGGSRCTLEAGHPGDIHQGGPARGPGGEGVDVSVPGSRDTRQGGSSHVAPSSVDPGPEAKS